MDCGHLCGIALPVLPILTFLAAAALTPPEEPLAGQLRAAIWYDLQLNAVIGNGNWIASLWYNAGQNQATAPDLHIQSMCCRNNNEGHRCAFTLWRDGGARMAFNEMAPDKLTCTAQFIRSNNPDGWKVKHWPPRGPGHSQTDLRCEDSSASR